MLKTIAILFVCVIAGVLIFAATRPDTFRVERTANIKAAPEKILSQIDDFRRWSAWSPYEKLDPGMKRTYSGATRGVGAIYGWESEGKAGVGRMEITHVSPEKVTIRLDFTKPFEASNTAEFAMVPRAGHTQVTWSMYGPTPYLAKIMHLFFDMDGLIGKDFETGLANLEAVAEK